MNPGSPCYSESSERAPKRFAFTRVLVMSHIPCPGLSLAMVMAVGSILSACRLGQPAEGRPLHRLSVLSGSCCSGGAVATSQSTSQSEFGELGAAGLEQAPPFPGRPRSPPCLLIASRPQDWPGCGALPSPDPGVGGSGGPRATMVPCLSSTARSGPARRTLGLPHVPRSPQPSTPSYVMRLNQH